MTTRRARRSAKQRLAIPDQSLRKAQRVAALVALPLIIGSIGVDLIMLSRAYRLLHSERPFPDSEPLLLAAFEAYSRVRHVTRFTLAVGLGLTTLSFVVRIVLARRGAGGAT
jgi:hypothetical protein